MALKCLLLLCFASCALLVAQDVSKGNDEASIRNLVQQYVSAREANNGKQIEQCFTADADQLVSSGEWRKGRDQVVRGTMESFSREQGHRTIAVETLRFPSPDVAIVDGRYELSGQSGGSTRKMWTTLICLRESSGWKIAAIRNMLPAPAATK